MKAMQGQISIDEWLESMNPKKVYPIWKRYPANNRGYCPNCNTEVYYDGSCGRNTRESWNPLERDYTGEKICPFCFTEFAPDAEFPANDYRNVPLISGLDDKPIADFALNGRRVIDFDSARRDIEQALGITFTYNNHLGSWQYKHKGMEISLDRGRAMCDFYKSIIKEGDDIIDVGYAYGQGGGGVAVESADEAISVISKYLDKIKPTKVPK